MFEVMCFFLTEIWIEGQFTTRNKSGIGLRKWRFNARRVFGSYLISSITNAPIILEPEPYIYLEYVHSNPYLLFPYDSGNTLRYICEFKKQFF